MIKCEQTIIVCTCFSYHIFNYMYIHLYIYKIYYYLSYYKFSGKKTLIKLDMVFIYRLKNHSFALGYPPLFAIYEHVPTIFPRRVQPNFCRVPL